MKKVLVILIISFVSISAGGSAFLILKKAIESDNSNLHLAKVFIYKHPIVNVFSALSRSNNITNDLVGLEANAYEAKVEKQEIVSDILPADCREPFRKISLVYNDSLVNFLHDNGYDFSLIARKKYAQYFGIENYKGTAEENQILMARILSETNILPSTSSSSCK